MDNLNLWVFILILISLNIIFYILFKRGKLNIMVSGIIMMILAPVIGFISGSLLLHFYDWTSGGTGEGAGYGGAFLGLLTFGNGVLILVIGTFRWVITLRKTS